MSGYPKINSIFRKLNFAIYILIIFLMTSCSVFNQQAYIATSPNVNCFERVHEKNVKVSAFLNHFDVQSNFAFTKNFGLSAGLNGAFRGQLGGELAGIYYRNLNEKRYFEVQFGYGYFKNKSTISRMPWDMGALIEYGKHYSRDINVHYHKFFVQPTYFWKKEVFKLGVALKISANYFDNYHYYYSIKDDSKGDYDYLVEESTADFRNRWNFAFEPAVKFGFGRSFFLQFSLLLTTNTYNSTVYKTHHIGYNDVIDEGYGEMRNPQQLKFLFTIGYELKFGKKKNKQV